jgi:hypothetical protein
MRVQLVRGNATTPHRSFSFASRGPLPKGREGNRAPLPSAPRGLRKLAQGCGPIDRDATLDRRSLQRPEHRRCEVASPKALIIHRTRRAEREMLAGSGATTPHPSFAGRAGSGVLTWPSPRRAKGESVAPPVLWIMCVSRSRGSSPFGRTHPWLPYVAAPRLLRLSQRRGAGALPAARPLGWRAQRRWRSGGV